MKVLGDLDQTLDWVLVDCPPDEGPLAMAALHAADTVIAPINMRDAESLLSLQTLKKTLAPIAEHPRRAPGDRRRRPMARAERQTAAKSIEATLDLIGLPVAEHFTTQSAEWENATNRRGVLVLSKPRSGESREFAEIALELWNTTTTQEGRRMGKAPQPVDLSGWGNDGPEKIGAPPPTPPAVEEAEPAPKRLAPVPRRSPQPVRWQRRRLPSPLRRRARSRLVRRRARSRLVTTSTSGPSASAAAAVRSAQPPRDTRAQGRSRSDREGARRPGRRTAPRAARPGDPRRSRGRAGRGSRAPAGRPGRRDVIEPGPRIRAKNSPPNGGGSVGQKNVAPVALRNSAEQRLVSAGGPAAAVETEGRFWDEGGGA